MKRLRLLRTGDAVRVRPMGSSEWVTGTVELASPNGQSVIVEFPGGVRVSAGVHLYGVALLIDYQEQKCESLFGDSFEIEKQGEEI